MGTLSFLKLPDWPEADLYDALAMKLVASQREIVADLDREGLDTADAKKLLAAFEAAWHQYHAGARRDSRER